MRTHLKNLDEILESAISPYPKKYLEEAIASYRVGAYRAAIILIWTAAIVDIVEKISELSVDNYRSTIKIMTVYGQAVENKNYSILLEFERDVLAIISDGEGFTGNNFDRASLDLISEVEKRHLKRVQEDRNFCAHPSFAVPRSQQEQQDQATQTDDDNENAFYIPLVEPFEPSAELTRTHILHVSNILLNQPAKIGKNRVDSLLKKIKSGSFPDEVKRARLILENNNYLGRAKDVLIRNLLRKLLRELFSSEQPNDSDADRICVAIACIKAMNPEVVMEEYKKDFSKGLSKCSDEALVCQLPYFIEFNPDAWIHVDIAQKSRLKTLIPSMSISQLSELPDLIWDDMKDVIMNHVHEQKQEAIQKFAGSSNYTKARLYGDKLVEYARFIKYSELKKLLLEQIPQNNKHENNQFSPKYNQILGAGNSMDRVFSDIYEETRNSQELREVWSEFWKIVIYENTDDDDDSEYPHFMRQQNKKYARLRQILIEDQIIFDTLIESSDADG